MITKRKMFSKKISLLVLVLMSASIDCQSNDSICGYLLKEGRVKDLGLYHFVSEGRISSRLFRRDRKDCIDKWCENTKEYELEISGSSVSAQSPAITDRYGFLKFFAGYSKSRSSYVNCWAISVCLLR